MTYQTRITQPPLDLQELISQHLHRSQMKEVRLAIVLYRIEKESMW
jgi:hypothetical protein